MSTANYSTFLIYLLVGTIVYYLFKSVTEKFDSSTTTITTSPTGTSIKVSNSGSSDGSVLSNIAQTTPSIPMPVSSDNSVFTSISNSTPNIPMPMPIGNPIGTIMTMSAPMTVNMPMANSTSQVMKFDTIPKTNSSLPSSIPAVIAEEMESIELGPYSNYNLFQDSFSPFGEQSNINVSTPFVFSPTATKQIDPQEDPMLPVRPTVVGSDPNLMQNLNQEFTNDSDSTDVMLPSPYSNEGPHLSIRANPPPRPAAPAVTTVEGTQHIDEFVPIQNKDFPGNDKFCQMYSADINQSYCRGQCSQDKNCVGYVDVKAGTSQLFPQGFCCSKNYIGDQLDTQGVISFIKPKYV